MKYTLRKYFTFSPEEIRSLIITILIVGFIFSFRDWGVDEFDLILGLKNFVTATLIVGLAYFVHEAAHRFFALSVGFRAEYKAWTFGLILSLVLVFISGGKWIILAPGGIVIHQLAGLRLGAFRYGLNYKTMGWVATAGPLANIGLAIFFKLMLLLPFVSPTLITKAIFINTFLAIFNMLPIPPLDGSKMFYGSRLVYAFVGGFIIAAGILLIYFNLIVALVGSVIAAIVIWLVYLLTFEEPEYGR